MAGKSTLLKILYSLLALTILVGLVRGSPALEKPGTGITKSTSSDDQSVLRQGRHHHHHHHDHHRDHHHRDHHHHHHHGGWDFGKK